MSKAFQKDIKIGFGDCDPAGILYFARIFSIAHEAFEDFVEFKGIPWKDWFLQRKYFIPIRHVECDFHMPFFPGHKYTVTAELKSISDSSFQMQYTFWPKKQGQDFCAQVKMVHTFVSPKTKKKTKIPKYFRDHLTN